MSNKTQISEIRLVDLVKKVWDKIHYIDDPPHVIQRIKNPPLKQLDLPLNVDADSRKGIKFKKKSKPQQQIFDFLKNPIKMPNRISKKDWRIGFDINKPPFYTNRDEWYVDNVKEKYVAKVEDFLDIYIGEDLTTYGFPYKTKGELPNNKFIYGLQIMNEWNKAKAYQVYYETKIANYLLQKKNNQNN